jgi:hypothetical protein
VPGFLLEERFLVKGKDFPEGWQQVPVVLVVFPPEGKEAVMLPRQERFPVGREGIGGVSSATRFSGEGEGVSRGTAVISLTRKGTGEGLAKPKSA